MGGFPFRYVEPLQGTQNPVRPGVDALGRNVRPADDAAGSMTNNARSQVPLAPW
jgi:hypothetical protein